jgi:hypothetical protein
MLTHEQNVMMLQIMNLIRKEREYQMGHGLPKAPEHGQRHSIKDWLRIMRREMVEAENGLQYGSVGRDHPLHEILQVITVGVACLEQHGLDFDRRMFE